MGELIDMTGRKVGRLLIIERSSNNKFGRATWECLCDCGNKTIVEGARLRTVNKTTSCGCYRSEQIKKRQTIHGDCKRKNTENGTNKTRLYRIWVGITFRCKNKNDRRYGGRGISVCNEWLNYECFKEWANSNGYHKDLSIDRINNDGNYEPDNCRWATRTKQSNNRSTNNRIIFNDENLTIAEWAKKIGISHSTLRDRLEYGWSIERALTTEKVIKRDQVNIRRMIVLNGVSRSIKEWADFQGFSKQVIEKRLRLGWSEYDAVMTPKMR
jgi:hypothetical protein